jgi:hypothetical protein
MTPLTGWPEPATAGILPAAPARTDHEVVELSLLLPRWQADALESAARDRGMTTGQMLRRVIADLFSDASPGGYR